MQNCAEWRGCCITPFDHGSGVCMPGKHLTEEQRAIIAGMLSVDPAVSCATVARQVGVVASTISRELRRDGTDRASWTAWSAQLDADVRRRRPKSFRGADLPSPAPGDRQGAGPAMEPGADQRQAETGLPRPGGAA